MKTPPADLAERLLGASELILATSPPARFDDIAERIGVARATLYYYFSGRDDLLSFVLAEHIRRGAEIIDAATGDSPAERLRVTVSGLVRFLGEHPELCPALLGAMGSAGRMRDALEANEISIAAPLRQIVSDGMEAGEFPEGDLADVTSALMGAILMQVVSRYLRSASLDSDETIADVTAIATRVVTDSD
ncbi:MAG: TetR/AcrR family transcriptional regulator [Ilumatobacteraceae bacterium]|nr:TetR/AcrR family transcriptional regulator [Ilumatobacteraceae bacterium]